MDLSIPLRSSRDDKKDGVPTSHLEHSREILIDLQKEAPLIGGVVKESDSR